MDIPPKNENSLIIWVCGDHSQEQAGQVVNG